MSWIKNHIIEITGVPAAISIPIVIFSGHGTFEDWGYISFGLCMLFLIAFLFTMEK